MGETSVAVDTHQPATDGKEWERERERKTGRLVTVECEVRLRRVGNGYVKENQQ